ncbi:MAG: winged helix DNA-binding protein [Peptoniphilaceae bacterium]|nr:winged helix DNA-binding protein [Peptoniphilaceae bacterium]MDY6018696.1 winged helix DNA-binding protein [Anaerococcus sp.]
MENNKKSMEVFDLFTSMKKVLGLLRDIHTDQVQNDLEKSILIYVKFHKDVNQSIIVDRLQVPKQTVSYTICKLEREGSIKTKLDEKDKRQKILTLTDKGKVFAEDSLKSIMNLHQIIYDEIGFSKISQMKKDIDEIITIIEKKTRR